VTTATAYESLEQRFARVRVLKDAAGILGWDAQAMMPVGAASSRAEQLALLRGLAHEALTSSEVFELLEATDAERSSLNPWQSANLREMRRAYVHAAALPAELVVAISKATSHAEMIWREARRTNDFALLLPHLKAVLDLQREAGQVKSEALGTSTYDALLDQYDPGLRQGRIDPLFDALRQELPALIAEALEFQDAASAPLPIKGHFPFEAQRALGETLMRAVGFDFNHGRLDISLHPFCGGASGDVRITTRYDEADFTRSLMGVLHETGHALYEQGRPAAWASQPVGQARGMTLHESQSLLIEMQACRSPEFLAYLSPLLTDAFGREDPAWSPENLHRVYTRVEPGFIRVDADEVTYPAHILLRYDLEKAMIAGDLPVADLPTAFNAGMKSLLGVTVTDDAQGCLQDIHWPSGAWGYFPTYTLGAIGAAQLFAAACAAEPNIRSALAGGDFGSLIGWLRTNVHEKGSLLDTDDLMVAATGEPLRLNAYRNHLRQRYLRQSWQSLASA
jgi:carboxypeptidase Taq